MEIKTDNYELKFAVQPSRENLKTTLHKILYIMQYKFFALHSSEAENSSQHHHHRSLHPYIQGSISAYESLCKPLKPFPRSRCVLHAQC